MLKISSVARGTFDATEYKVAVNPSAVKKIVHPKKGDLLFSRANTQEMVGATAIVDADYEQLILPDKLWRLDCGDRIIVPYLKAYLSIADTRRELSKMATGTSGSMFNISMQKLKSLPIPVPFLALQQEFADFVARVDKSRFDLLAPMKIGVGMRLFPRDNYLMKIRGFYHDAGMIKFITGARRCSKSCLMAARACRRCWRSPSFNR